MLTNHITQPYTLQERIDALVNPDRSPHLSLGTLLVFAEGRFEESLAIAIQEHIGNCPECSHRAESVRVQMQTVSAPLTQSPFLQGLKGRVKHLLSFGPRSEFAGAGAFASVEINADRLPLGETAEDGKSKIELDRKGDSLRLTVECRDAEPEGTVVFVPIRYSPEVGESRDTPTDGVFVAVKPIWGNVSIGGCDLCLVRDAEGMIIYTPEPVDMAKITEEDIVQLSLSLENACGAEDVWDNWIQKLPQQLQDWLRRDASDATSAKDQESD